MEPRGGWGVGAKQRELEEVKAQTVCEGEGWGKGSGYTLGTSYKNTSER